MKKYTLTRAAFFDAGTVLGLNEKQARVRAHQIEKIKDGVFKATAIVSLKAGEVVGLENLPRHLESAVEEIVAKTAAKRTEQA